MYIKPADKATVIAARGAVVINAEGQRIVVTPAQPTHINTPLNR